MTCPGSRALTHSNPHVTGVARSAFTGPKHYQSIASSTSPRSLRDKMASIQQLSVSALFYSLKCKSSQADPAMVIQFITSTAPITCGCFTSTCTHQRPQVEWKQKAFLTYRPHWNPPLFRGCVSQIFLWRNPIMSLNRVSNLQYTELYQASIWSKILAQFRELLLPVIHISHLLRSGYLVGSANRVKLRSQTLSAPFLAQSLTCFAWWAQTYYHFSLWTQSRKLNTHQIRITTII